jgi:dolichol kinase
VSIINDDLLGSIILLILFSTTILLAEIWTRIKRPDPELTRKLVHIVGGLGCLLFPFFISSPLVVVLMAGVFAAVFAFGQKSDLLQCLSSVGRKSRGSEYYPIAVAFLFYVSQGRWWLYFVSILILTLADAAAALIGGRFGRLRYKVGAEDTKSVEGSMVFLAITFLIIAGLLYLLTAADLEMCLLIAFLVAVLLTGIEAISVGGTDNVFIPVLTCYALLKIITKPVAEVRFQVISMVVIFISIVLLSRVVRLLSVRDFIIFFIFTYGTWSLGSTDWSIPVFICFGGYALVRFFVKYQEYESVGTAVLLRILMIPLAILLVANASDQYRLMYGPYLLAVLLPSLMGIWAYLLTAKKDSLPSRFALLAALSLAGAVVGWGAALTQSGVGWPAVAVLPLFCGVILIVFNHFAAKYAIEERSEVWSRPIWLLTLIGALACYLLQQQGLLQLWNPQY